MLIRLQVSILVACFMMGFSLGYLQIHGQILVGVGHVSHVKMGLY